MSKFRWQDGVVILIGIWIAASPWILGFDAGWGLPTLNALIAGLLIVALAAVDMDAPAKWEEGGLIALGVWTMVSAPLLGFFGDGYATTTMMSMVVSGALVVAFAGWELSGAMHPAKIDERAHSH